MRPATGWALFALLSAIWGSTWLAIKVGYGGLGPYNVASLRFLLAGALLLPAGLLMGVPWPKGRLQWGLVAYVGVMLFAFQYGLVYWGEQSLDSGLTAVLFAVMPVLTALAAHAYLPGEPLTARKLFGTLVAFGGVAALFAESVAGASRPILPMLAIVAASGSAALTTVVTKRHGGGLHPVALNGPAMFLGGLVLAASSFAAGDGFALPTDPVAWQAIVYLAIAGSVLTFLVYFHLLRTWDATNLSFIAVFTPVVAVVLGLVVLRERPTAWTFAGAALVLLGVTLALRRKRS